MQEFKIQSFQEAYSHRFPNFTSIDVMMVQALHDRIMHHLTDKKQTLSGKVYAMVRSKATRVENADAERADFDIYSVFKEAGIQTQHNLYIDWNNGVIDTMNTSDFIRYFSDIWYPSSDDILLFDETTTWFVSISHEGEVFCLVS